MSDTRVSAEHQTTPGAEGPAQPRRLRAAVAVFAGVTAIMFWRPLLGLGEWIPKDLVDRYPPWTAEAPRDLRVHNRMVGDVVDNYAEHSFFFSEARRGRFATWDPHLVSGQPFAGKAVFFPLNVVFLVLPHGYAFGLLGAAKMFLGMLFMFLFLRQLGVRYWASALGGVAFGVSAFQVVWLGWPQTDVTMLIPALFWTAERVIRRPTGGRATALAAVWGAMLLGAFPPLAAMAVYALAPYVLVRLWMLRTGAGIRAIAWMGGAFVVGSLAAGIYLLPFAAFAGTIDLGYRANYGRTPLMPLYLVTALVPNAYGSHTAPETWWGPGSNYVEVQIYAGVATLIFAASSVLLARRRSDAEGPTIALSLFFLGAAAFSLMMAFGLPRALLSITSKLPVFSNNPPGRMRSIYSFAIAASAGLGAHAWSGFLAGKLSPKRFKRALVVAFAGLVVAAGVAVLLALGPWRDYVDGVRSRSIVRYTLEQFGYAVFFGLATLGLLVFAVVRRPRPRSVFVPAVLLLSADLLLFALPFWPVAPAGDTYPRTAAHGALASVAGTDRFLGLQWSFAPNSPLLADQREAHGHAFFTPGYRAILTRIDPTAFAPPNQPTLPYFRPDKVDERSLWLDRLSIRALAADPRAEPIGLTVVRSGDPKAVEGGMLDGTAERAVPRLPRPLAGVRLHPLAIPQPDAVITVALVAPDGRVVGSSSRRAFETGAGAWILPATRIDRDGYRLRFASTGPVDVRWSGSAPDVEMLGTESDAVQPAGGDAVVIYRRSTALPRARFAGAWTVEKPDLTTIGSRPLTAPVSVDRSPGIGSPGSGAAGGATGDATIVTDEVDEVRVRVRTNGPGLMVLADAYAAGWVATVDGRAAPVLRAEGLLRAVPVSAGEHTVILRYRPKAVKAGAFASVAGVAIMLAVALLSRRRQRETALAYRRSRAHAASDSGANQDSISNGDTLRNP